MEGKKYDKSQLFQLLFIWGLCVVLIFGSGITTNAQKSLKGIVFDHPSGFYNSPFTLGVTTVNENAKLLYTTDGSNPAYVALGEYWESLGGSWGGRFKDANHFSIEHDGYK